MNEYRICGRVIVSNGMTNLLLMQQTIQYAFNNGDLTNLNPNIGPDLCKATFNSQLAPTN